MIVFFTKYFYMNGAWLTMTNRPIKRRKKRKSKKPLLLIPAFAILAICIIITIKKNRENKIFPGIYYDADTYSLPETVSNSDDAMSNLSTTAHQNDDYQTVLDHRQDYPDVLMVMLSNNPDMLDYVLDYPTCRGEVYSDSIGDMTKGTFPLLLQYDKRWGYGMYGDDTIAINGCGPTCVSMVVAGLTGRSDITPYTVAKYADENGYFQDGTSWSFFTTGVSEFEISGSELPLDESSMKSALESGHPIICSMAKGDFTTTGHLIVLTGVKNGKFIVNDPNSPIRSKLLWSYDRIEGQIKNLWEFEEG